MGNLAPSGYERESVLPEQSDVSRGGGGPGATANRILKAVVAVVLAIGLAMLIQALIVKPYLVTSASMMPTLHVGERTLVNRLAGHFGDPERGDIVVFKPPAGAAQNRCGVKGGEQYLPGKVYRNGAENLLGEKMPCPKGAAGQDSENFIKRVIGLPGERLKIIKGHAFINDRPLHEPYISSRDSCDEPGSFSSDCTFSLNITIPQNMYFMMGDNRNASADSRYWGPVPKNNMIGQAFMTYWPPKRFGLL
jgi:signal peptidase I